MTQQTLRLIHASDLHLERPLYGLAEIPDHLRDLLIEAPYQAAEQVFETALAENADAVLLAGDVLDVDRAGPPAIVLLLDQFARLGDRGIPVYWAGGAIDLPDRWPRSVALPDNVHVFPVNRLETLDLVRDGEMIARVQGASCQEGGQLATHGFHRDAHGLPTIGVAWAVEAGGSPAASATGEPPVATLQGRVHYLALGGRHRQQTVHHEPGIAHYSGTPQGRGPHETGPHGCTMVTVDETGCTKTRFTPTDAVRWTEQSIEVTAALRTEELYERMVDRLEKLQAKHPDVDHLVRWNVRGRGALVNRLRPGGLADELLRDLRRRFGECSPLAWSVSLDCSEPLSVPAEWYDQETVLGDFLRQVCEFESNVGRPLDLGQFLPDDVRNDPFAAIARVDSPEDRARLVASAAKLGIDLLTPPLERDGSSEE